MELTGGHEDNPRPATAPSQSEVESLRLEVANLRAERAALQSQLSAHSVKGSNERLRRSLIALLAGASCVLIFLSLMTVWVHQTVLDTDGFVAAVGPVVDRPNVTQAMSVELTTQIFEAIDVERQIKQVLPSQGQFLAAPLTSAAENFVQGQVRNVLRSPQFRAVWFTVLRAAHKEVLAALRGQSSVLSVTNGAVVLNTLPLVNAALQQVQSLASGLLGRHVTIPPLTNGELPAQVRATLSEALGVKLPADFGQIELARIRLARPGHQRRAGTGRFVLAATPLDPFGHFGGAVVVTQPPSDRAADIDRHGRGTRSREAGGIVDPGPGHSVAQPG